MIKTKTFKIAILLVQCVCIFLLISCNKQQKTISKPQIQPVTFTFFSSDGTEDIVFNDPVAKVITEKTGVTLILSHPIANDINAIQLMLANGDYTDFVFAKSDLTMMIETGAVIPLDDLIEKHGHNIKKLYGDQIVRLKNTLADPRVYSVGTYDVKKGIYETSGTLQIQHAVLKEFGYPRISTLDEYSDLIRRYLIKYPEINGKKTIGFSLLIDTWQWMIDLSNPGNYLIGYPDDGQWIVNQETFDATYKFFNPDIWKYYKWLNGLNAEGLLDPESFTQKEDVWKSKIADGRILGMAYPVWGYGDPRLMLIQKGMSDRTYAYLPITAGPEYKDPSLKDYGYTGGYGIAITSACMDPERAFKFLDWFCSEEAQILINWGIKDINYKVVDGKRVFLDQIRAESDPNYTKETGVGRWVYPFPEAGTAAKDSNGDWISRSNKDAVRRNYLPVEKETLAAYGVENWVDLFPSSESLGVSKHGQLWQYSIPTEISTKVTQADDYVKTALIKAILSKPEDFDKIWLTMQQHLRDMGMEQAGEEITKLIKDKMKLWGEIK